MREPGDLTCHCRGPFLIVLVGTFPTKLVSSKSKFLFKSYGVFSVVLFSAFPDSPGLGSDA
jgi:hypothetical protein